jgi:hypothetical protein
LAIARASPHVRTRDASTFEPLSIKLRIVLGEHISQRSYGIAIAALER